MMHKQDKLEKPERLEELRPLETLRRIGIQADSEVCDIGAGTGIFTIPAASMTDNTVYAVEIDQQMLDIIAAKAQQQGLENIRPLKVHDNQLDIADATVDVVIMVTVLHELDTSTGLLDEYQRILKPGGKLAVIEFYKRVASMGPPMAMRLSEEDVEELLRPVGLALSDRFNLSGNMYGLVFKKTPIA